MYLILTETAPSVRCQVPIGKEAYVVATTSRLLEILGLFCRIWSLL